MTTNTQDRIARIERMLEGIRRDQRNSSDYEAADSTLRSVEAIAQEVFDLRAELEPEVEELIAA